MIRVIIELILRSVRGRIRRSFDGFKHPLRFVICIAAFVFLVAVPVMTFLLDPKTNVTIQTPDISAPLIPIIQTGIILILAAAISIIWLIPRKSPVLKLGDAEIQFLLPAPISSRHVIQYLLYKKQASFLLTSLIFSVFKVGFSVDQPILFITTMLKIWMYLTLFDYHFKGASLWKLIRRNLSQSGRKTAANLMFVSPILLIIGFWSVVLPCVIQAAKSLVDGITAFHVPEIFTPLLPLTNQLLEKQPASDWLTLSVILILLVVHHEWVIKMQLRYQEIGTIKPKNQKTSDAPFFLFWKQFRVSLNSHPFVLKSTGRSVVAICWKSFIQVTRIPIKHSILLAVIFFAIMASLTNLIGSSVTLAGIFGFVGIFLTFNACFLNLGNDIHNDFLNYEMVKVWPISGFQLISGKVITSAFISAFIGMTGIGCLILASIYTTRPYTMDSLLGYIALSIIPIYSGIASVFSALHCFPPLLFPSYFVRIKDKDGFADIGLKTIRIIAMMLALCICVIPAVIIPGVILLVQNLMGNTVPLWEYPLLSLLPLPVLLLESALLCFALGRLWDRMDPSDEVFENQ